MATTLYITGNGFDRHHGLETRYQAFAFYLQKKHSDIYELLIQYFGLSDLDPGDDKSYSDPLWAEFENELASLDFETVLEDNSNYIASPSSPDFRDSDWHAYQIEMEGIVNTLTVDLRKAFKEFILAVNFPASVEHKLIGLEKDAVFLNFNYTDTLERDYFVHWKRILYIHGKARLPEEGIVLGHGREPGTFAPQEATPPEGLDEEQLAYWEEEMANRHDYSYDSGKAELLSYFNGSFKSTKEIIEKQGSFFDSLAGVRKIYVLGHSIAPVDQPYFKKIMGTIADKSIPWVVSYHADSERASHLERLVQLGLTENQIELVKMDTLKRTLPSLF